MQKIRKIMFGAVFTACAVIAASLIASCSPATAAEPSAYLPTDTKWVVVADIDAILNSPVIKAKGIDLNALFQAAVADEDAKITTMPSSIYVGIVNFDPDFAENNKIAMAISGTEACIKELTALIMEEGDATPKQIGSVSGYAIEIEDNYGFAAVVAPTVLLVTSGLDDAAIQAAAAGRNTAIEAKDDCLLYYSGPISDPSAGEVDVEAILADTGKDIQLKVIGDVHDADIAAMQENEIKSMIQTLPVMFAGMNAAASVAAIQNISVERDGSVLTITIPQLDVIAAELTPVIMEMMAPQEIDWDDEDIDWDDDFEY